MEIQQEAHQDQRAPASGRRLETDKLRRWLCPRGGTEGLLPAGSANTDRQGALLRWCTHGCSNVTTCSQVTEYCVRRRSQTHPICSGEATWGLSSVNKAGLKQRPGDHRGPQRGPEGSKPGRRWSEAASDWTEDEDSVTLIRALMTCCVRWWREIKPDWCFSRLDAAEVTD